MKRISFIISYYNEPHELLRECVDSVLSLSLRAEEREILLIDDGSDVPLPEWDDVTVVRQENQGLSAARNKGIELAQGEYIQFLDADDYLLKDAYEWVLKQQLECQPDMLIFGFTHQLLTGKSIEKGIAKFDSGIDFLQTKNMHASACCYLFRRSLLGDLRFCPGILHEDDLFTPQLLLRTGKLLQMDCIPYYYRLRSNTITHNQEAEHIQKRLDDTLFVIRELDGISADLQGKAQEAMRRRISQLTMDYLYIVWQQTSDKEELHRRVSQLRDAGLYPLPLRTYTGKYWLFALMSHFLKVIG